MRDRAEQQRLDVLRSFDVLDTPAESDFDELTALAAELCGTRISLVSLIDADRQWFKSRHGVAVCETSLDESFCVHALESEDVLVIPDARLDARVSEYRCVREDPYFRFYAGAPLVADGEILGTLCVADSEARDLRSAQRRQLRVLAAQVVAQLLIRRQAAKLAKTIEEMHSTKRMLDGVLKHTDVLIYAKDVHGRYVMVNPAVQQATGTTVDMIGRTDHDLFAPDIVEEYRRNDSRIMTSGERQIFTEHVVGPDGQYRTYKSTKFPVYDDAGVIIGTAGLSTDVSELEAARAAHEESETRLRTLVEHSPVAIVVIDQDGGLAYVNPAAVILCGATSDSGLQGRRALDLVVPEDRRSIAALLGSVLRAEPDAKTGRARIRRGDDDITVEVTVSRINYSGKPALQAEVRDITADLSDREHLENIANTDALTEMLNRRAWTSRVTSMRADSQPGLVLAMIDIDRFKAYNDSHGHLAGDDLLRQIADVLRTSARRSDVLARWGGEEFVVALSGIDTSESVDILEHIRCAMPAAQTCSIGYTAWADDEDLNACIARADEALYAAKRAGRNRIVGL